MNALANSSNSMLMPLIAQRSDRYATAPSRQSFGDVLKPSSPADQQSVRKAATQFVSSAFVLPVLSQLRDSTLKPKTGPFAQSTVEKRFGPLLDERLADQITQAAKFPLIDAIVNRVAKNQPSTQANPTVSLGKDRTNVTA